MAFDPDQYIAQTGGFDPDQYLKATAGQAPEIGKGESFLRGTAQGATLGFADEATGVSQAVKDYILNKNQSKSFGDDYTAHRDESRANYRAAEEANPKTSLAGNLVGGAATIMAAPELALGKGAVGIGKLAALGAAQGLGDSEADLTKGQVGGAAWDATKGGIVGGVLGAAAPQVGRVIGRVPGMLATGAKKAVSSILGPSIEAIDARLANPGAIKAAGEGGLSGIAEKLPGAMSKLDAQIGKGADAARDTLSPDLYNSPGVMTKDQIIRQINQLQSEMKTGGQVLGDAKNSAFNKLEGWKQKINSLYANKKGMAAQFSDRIPETDLKSIIQSVDPDINWAAPENKPINAALERFRGGIDANLKENNPAYGEAMDPLSKKMQLYSYLQRKFNLKNAPGGELTPSDATLSNLKNALGDSKAVSQDALADLKTHTGADIAGDIQNYKYAQQFQGGYTNGSRNAVTGAALGGAVGHFLPVPGGAWLGSAAGAVVGRNIDKKGGEYAGKMIDSWVSNKGFGADRLGDILKKAPERLGKWAPRLQAAAQRGPQSLAVTHYILQQSEPDYGTMMKQAGQ